MIALGVAAFVVVVLELVAAVAGVLLARRFWRQVGPQLRPMLAMFAPATPVERIGEYAAGSSSSASDPAVPPPASPPDRSSLFPPPASPPDRSSS